MRIQRHITQFIAVSLAILMLGATAPVSAAEIAAPANIGSVSAVGSVQLRGVGISEGTLFSGDRLNVAPGGYAKVVFGAGPKIEVDGNSDVTVSKDADSINIQMTSGNIAFTGNGQKPVRVRVGTYEITTTSQARGSVAFVGSEAFGVRVMDGTVTVRNTSTKQSYTLTKGSDRLISLNTSSQPGALLASTNPTSIPAAPAMPARQGLSGGAKTALLVGAVLGSAAAIAILISKNDDTDADAAARLRLTTSALTVDKAQAAAATAASTASQVASASASANTAIAAATVTASFTQAEKNALVLRAQNLTSAANASATQIATLNAQLNALEAQIQGASPATVAAIESQVLAITAALNTEITNLNSLITQLNSLVNDARAEVPNILPIPTIQPVATVTPATPTNP